ncbi:MAG: energy-coupled thiamine transporter ThiT [Eubacterium sp.]
MNPNVKQMTFCALCIALGVVMSYIKFASLPFGGSITLFSMFFVMLPGYLFGVRTGIMTGVAYGILQFLVDPYIAAPIQLLIDYPLAFGALGLSGMLHRKKYGLIGGYLLGVFGRYIFHVISGYVFFASYAPEGINPLIYTLGYNLTYLVPETIVTVIILSIPVVRRSLQSVLPSRHR